MKFFRHAFVKCILATDLALSLEYVSKFQSLTTNMASAELTSATEGKPALSLPRQPASAGLGGGREGEGGYYCSANSKGVGMLVIRAQHPGFAGLE